MNYPTYFKDYATLMFSNGYEVVPLVPGQKRPSIDEWTDFDIDAKTVAKWAGNGKASNGVGVKTRRTPVIDIDVRDKDLVVKLVAWCDENIGVAPRRVGLKPKAALFFRCDASFGKLQSKEFEDDEGLRHKVEILGDGQQCVAYAIHPDSKKPYQFKGPDLCDTPREALPVLTEEKARDFIQYFEDVAELFWDEVASGSSTAARVEDDFEQALEMTKPPLDISPQKVKRVLKSISPDCSYHQWCNVIGKALYHQFDGDFEGLDIWDEWSAGGASYEPGLCERKWETFSAYAKPGVKTITFASVLKLAKDEAGEDKENCFERWLDELLYVAEGDLVCDLSKPPHRCLLRLQEFKNLKSNIFEEEPAPTKKDPDKTKKVPAALRWLQHPERKDARGSTYVPGGGRVVTDDHGTILINSFHLPVSKVDYIDIDKIKIFKDHMRYLIPNKIEREWFTGWLAFNLQRPEERCKVTPLHVSIEHGTGRGWVVELIGHLVGQWNCSKTKMATLSGEGGAGAYNDYIDRSLVCCIEEVREGGKRFGVSDKTRDVLSDPYLEVNKKYGMKETKRVYTNFFFMSNHPDALVLTEEDRRINVLSGPEFLQPQSYYSKIYDWLKTDGVDHLRNYLLQYDLTNFNWQRSFKTPGRSLMIESNRTPTESAFIDLMASPPSPIMTQQQIVETLGKFEEIDEWDIDEKQVNKLLQHHARHLTKLKVSGKTVRPWQLVKGKNYSNEEIRAILAKN